MSKGSNRRPATVPPATVDANYARTFGVQSGGVVMTRDMYHAMRAHVESLPEAHWIERTPSGRADAEG